MSPAPYLPWGLEAEMLLLLDWLQLEGDSIFMLCHSNMTKRKRKLLAGYSEIAEYLEIFQGSRLYCDRN